MIRLHFAIVDLSYETLTNDPHPVRFETAELLHLLVQSQNLVLFRRALASEQVADSKRHQLRSELLHGFYGCWKISYNIVNLAKFVNKVCFLLKLIIVFHYRNLFVVLVVSASSLYSMDKFVQVGCQICLVIFEQRRAELSHACLLLGKHSQIILCVRLELLRLIEVIVCIYLLEKAVNLLFLLL